MLHHYGLMKGAQVNKMFLNIKKMQLVKAELPAKLVFCKIIPQTQI